MEGLAEVAIAENLEQTKERSGHKRLGDEVFALATVKAEPEELMTIEPIAKHSRRSRLDVL